MIKKNAERASKPWLYLNDIFRMSLTVTNITDAQKITDYILETLLHNGRTKINMKAKLDDPSLRNITIHGYNFKLGGCFLTNNISSVIGAEIQVRVDPDLMREDDEEEEGKEGGV
jgi:hypothetical protein